MELRRLKGGEAYFSGITSYKERENDSILAEKKGRSFGQKLLALEHSPETAPKDHHSESMCSE